VESACAFPHAASPLAAAPVGNQLRAANADATIVRNSSEYLWTFYQVLSGWPKNSPRILQVVRGVTTTSVKRGFEYFRFFIRSCQVGPENIRKIVMFC